MTFQPDDVEQAHHKAYKKVGAEHNNTGAMGITHPKIHHPPDAMDNRQNVLLCRQGVSFVLDYSNRNTDAFFSTLHACHQSIQK